ncbi:MAG: adenylate/guanylate cyclase domain-containing protein [Allorhizobium sp.]
MESRAIVEILGWLSTEAIQGTDNATIFDQFCQHCRQGGLPISYGVAIMDTLHPEFEGHAFQWDSDRAVEKPVQQYLSSQTEGRREVWESSVFNHLLVSGDNEMRCEIGKGAALDYHRLPELAREGHTDYLATIHRFTDRGSIGEMDALYSAWATRAEGGFSDQDLEALRALLPTLALAMKSGSSVSIIKTLARVYLGKDAAGRVIRGQIARGAVDTIDAVIWFSDLKNYTEISDQADPQEIIPFLNDYSGMVIDAIHRHGGNVLKLMGDGVLAIFRGPDMQQACASAIDAEAHLRRQLALLDARRSGEGTPTTGLYVGLHIGRVFYGNIGSRNRLDFTVVGPAVNEVSRICGTCRPSGVDVLLSDDFVAACAPERQAQLKPVGRFSLRGVRADKMLFTRASA